MEASHHHMPLVPSLAHRAEVIVFHSFRFVAKSCKSCVFRPIVFASLSIVLLSVSFGLPLFLLPFGDHMMVCRGILSSLILSAWPMYAQHLFLIVFVIYFCFVSSLS